MFESVSPSVAFAELERRVLAFWHEQRVFEKSVEMRREGPPFVFYEGPPTANGMPHPGHVLTRVIKDVFLRYRTMSGFHVPRRGGWDTHGLPVEVEVEKELGIHGRLEIERYGVEAFTRKCIDSVFRYIEEWKRMTQRIAFWVDLDEAYVTFHRSYVESVWWALAELYKQGLLYQDYKIVWWWPQGGTALSAGEVGQGYRTVDDPSVIVRFPLVGVPMTSLLAWTTTPWTLPSNVALAVHPELTYVKVELENHERLILAEALVERVLGKKAYTVVETYAGTQLEGLTYAPLFTYAEPTGGKAYQVVTADFVTLDAGTGIVHMAPAFGEDDFRIAKQKGLGFLQLVKPDGTFPPEVTDFAGRFCKEADRDIIRHLRREELLFHEESYRHEYPFCWRADQDPLIQYARRSWFIRTTERKDDIIANNQAIEWVPEHIKDGRFGEFLRSNVDWALSRERFWGTPLPIWVNDETGAMHAIASVEEILELNPQAFVAFDDAKKLDPTLSDHLRVHKPWIDSVTWQKPGEPGVYRRVSEVIDCWFDSGCMPFAQQGYPHANAAAFERLFPADFITEAVDQTRGWFYSLLAISSLLFPDQAKPHPFKNCVVLGLISDEKGQKLSKSKKNYEDPMTMIEKHGADAVRWSLYVSSVPGQNTRFFSGAAVEAVREFLLKIWNVYSFFVTYARIDEWKPRNGTTPQSDMDRWILAELNATVSEVAESLEHYKSYPAARRIQSFVDALSNWYVRRSRGRFWAEGESADKEAAFATLYEVLVRLSKLLSPFVPFVSETLYQNLVRTCDSEAPVSVHLTAFPERAAESPSDRKLRDAMDAVRLVVALGQRVRATNKIKVRQPLLRAIVVLAPGENVESIQQFESAIKEELNVHEVVYTTTPETYAEFVLVPNFRALGPRIGKQLPSVKAALAKADGSALHRELDEKGKAVLDVEGGSVELGPSDIEIRLQAHEGYAAAAERGKVVVLDTHITDELRIEGVARELINRVQKARKDMDLPYETRIRITYEGANDVAEAMRAHRELIAGETLAAGMSSKGGVAPPGEEHVTEIDGQPCRLWVERLQHDT